MSEEVPTSTHGHVCNVDFAQLFYCLLDCLLRHQRVRCRVFGEVNTDRMRFARMRSGEAGINRKRDALKMKDNNVNQTRNLQKNNKSNASTDIQIAKQNINQMRLAMRKKN